MATTAPSASAGSRWRFTLGFPSLSVSAAESALDGAADVPDVVVRVAKDGGDRFQLLGDVAEPLDQQPVGLGQRVLAARHGLLTSARASCIAFTAWTSWSMAPTRMCS